VLRLDLAVAARRISGRIGVSSGQRPHDQVLRNQSVGSRCSVAGVGPAIGRGDLDQDVVRAGLGVFDLDVEVAVLREGLRVGDLVLGLSLSAARFLDQLLVGIGALRIFIERRAGRNGSAAPSR
jgi:hypothetical protein